MKDISWPWTQRINIIEISALLQSHPYIQCNPYQNLNDIFDRNRKLKQKQMETEKILESQSSAEKE